MNIPYLIQCLADENEMNCYFLPLLRTERERGREREGGRERGGREREGGRERVSFLLLRLLNSSVTESHVTRVQRVCSRVEKIAM